jgi:hypothetical protein
MRFLRRHRWTLGATLSALVLVLSFSVSSTSSASVALPAAKDVFHLVTKATNIKLLVERPIPGGDYTASWDIGKVTVAVAAPARSTVTVTDSSQGFADVSVTVPAIPETGNLVRTIAAAYRSGAKSLEQDALAVGYTRSEAAKLNVVRPDATILSTPCVTVTADSKKISGRSCDEHELAQKESNGHWILSDEVTGSASSTDVNNDLYQFAAYTAYPAGNSIFQWRPNSTQSIGSCKSVTESLSWAGSGYTSSTTDCPDSISPYDATTGTKFGSVWAGCAWVEVVGANSVDLDNNPTRSSDGVTVSAALWWKSCIF